MGKSNLPAKSVTEFLTTRRTTRDFLPTSIPDEVLREVLADALKAPSWSNTRPFMIAVAKGNVRDELSAEFSNRWDALSKIKNSGRFGKLKVIFNRYGLPSSNWITLKPYKEDLKPRAFRVGKELYEWIGIERSDRTTRDNQWKRNYQFFGAPVELFIFIHKSLDIFAASDAGLAMENLMLSAHAHGLGTCAQGALSIWDDAVREKFDVPKQYRLLCGLAIGYPSDAKINSFEANRIDQSEILIPLRKSK
jgi:nitroreductase